jgi:hypothetical protein
MRGRVSIVALALVGVATGCAMTPEEQAAADKAWAERDRRAAAECADRYPNAIYMSGSCVLRGGMPGGR